MNIAQTLLPVKQATNATVSDRNNNSDLRGGTKKSFNNMFNNAAARAEKPSATDAGQIPSASKSDISQPEGAVLSDEIPSGQLKEKDIFSEQQTAEPDDLLRLEQNGADSSDSLQRDQELAVDPAVVLASILTGLSVYAEPVVSTETTVAPVPLVNKTRQSANLVPSVVQKSEQIPSPISMIIPAELEAAKTAEPHRGILSHNVAEISTEANCGSTASSNMPQSLAAKAGIAFQSPAVTVAATAANFNDQGRQNPDTSQSSPYPIVQPLNGSTLESTTTNSQTFMPGLEAVLAAKTDPMLTTPAAEAQPAKQPADVHQVVSQIVEKTRIISKLQNTEMIIKLKPEHLGELTLKVVIDKGAVNASFHSNNAEVRSLIEASLAQLKQELTNNGLKVENMSVSTGLSQFSPNHEHDRSFRQQIIKTNSKKNAEDTIAAIENQAAQQAGVRPDGLAGVDYRV